jgi:hypothetical protein
MGEPGFYTCQPDANAWDLAAVIERVTRDLVENEGYSTQLEDIATLRTLATLLRKDAEAWVAYTGALLGPDSIATTGSRSDMAANALLTFNRSGWRP